MSLEKIARVFHVKVKLKPPKVPYLETIKGRAENVEGKLKKQSGGRGQFGVCYLTVEPGERGSGVVFLDEIVGGSIPRQFIPAVEKGVRETCDRGVIAGFHLTDIRISVIDGKYHAVDSSEMAFKTAGSLALRAAVNAAKPILLEPIMTLAGDGPGPVRRRRHGQPEQPARAGRGRRSARTFRGDQGARADGRSAVVRIRSHEHDRWPGQLRDGVLALR